jgi:hypothetical protein
MNAAISSSSGLPFPNTTTATKEATSKNITQTEYTNPDRNDFIHPFWAVYPYVASYVTALYIKEKVAHGERPIKRLLMEGNVRLRVRSYIFLPSSYVRRSTGAKDPVAIGHFDHSTTYSE